MSTVPLTAVDASTPEAPPFPAVGMEAGQPLYAGVKEMILSRIRSGQWQPGQRISSEYELVAELGVSRMTVNRALRELSIEGVLVRRQGLGSFVAEVKRQANVFEVRNIADEITARGHAYSAQVVVLDAQKATPEVADLMGRSIGSEVFHSIILHCEDEIPVQLEERYVHPDIAPDYLAQDFSASTPNQYLTGIAPWTEAEHQVEAVMPAPWEFRLLGIARTDPCLLIRRRTWAGERVVTSVRLLLPGGRCKIESRQRLHPE